MTLCRRDFLQAAATAGLAAAAPARIFADSEKPARPKIAAVFTSFTHRSHAHVILENFLQPYLFNGKRTDPGVDVVSFYADQNPSGDMVPDVARKFKIPLFKTIDEALCLGGRELAVDAVLSIGEHGKYPVNKLGQMEYPRERFFDACVDSMQRSRRIVPVYNDKHLSYRWEGAKRMHDTAVRLGIPLMAGSSVPLAQRIPPLELPADAAIVEAVSIHGGPVESYDFHGLEVLQSLVEARRGGETGIANVELLTGDSLWKAAEEGRWSLPLVQAALDAELRDKKMPVREFDAKNGGRAHGMLLAYKSGLKAIVLKLGESAIRWNFACQIEGERSPRATSFYVGPWNNRNLFKALSHAIQHHFIHRESPYPVERTLLVTGALDASMHSRAEKRTIETPHLAIAYKPKDFRAMREMGETWKIITEQTREPEGIMPHGVEPSR
jgi:hypothetical protein